MFKKHFQDVIQTILKEFQKHQTKQRNLKYVNIGIRHRTSMIKPETLAIGGSNEKHESSADGLRLARLFDAVFKKFVNPKLDLMATLEQIKAMESKRRDGVLMSLRGFLNFENRSRVPALPATSSPSRDDKSLPPDELSIGWTGQPTIKRIACNVETSSHPRGFDYAFLNFPEFKEDFEKSHPPPMEPPVVRLKKTRSKSNTKRHRRRKISPETAPTPEFPTVDSYGNSSVIVQDATLNSSDGQNLKEHVLETETFQLKRAASEDSTNNNKSSINVSLEGLSLDNNFSLKQLNSPESLQGREYLNYKSVQEVKLVGQKSIDEIAQDTRSNDIVSSQQTKQLDSEPDITQSADENTDFAKEHVNTSSSENITNHQPMAHACNKELEGVDVDDKGKDHCTEYDSSEKTRNFDENDYGNHRIGIDSYKIGSSVDKENEFHIPKKLIAYAPSTASLKGRDGYAKPEQGRAPLRKERGLEIGEFPEKNWFVNTETNEFTPGREAKFGLKEKTKVRHSKLTNKPVPKSVSIHSNKDINSKKDILNEKTIIDGKKKNIARNTKSESNLRPERKAIEAERQFSKSSLRKLNTNKISAQANYFKNKRHKAQGSYKKIGEQNESKGLQSKMKLPKLPENVRDIISKNVTFKAGNYKLRSKHFMREKFSSGVSLKRTKRKNSASKYSLDLHVDNSFEIAKKKINKPGTFLSKHASKGNVAITSLSPPRPRKALTVKGIKRTKVISNSNPALPNSNKNYTYFKEPSKPSADKGRNKLPDYAKKVKSNKSKTKLSNKGSSNMLAQNKSDMKLINPKYLSNPKLTYVDKNKHVSQSKYNVGKRVKNFTLDESKVGKEANSAGSILNASKVRRHQSMRLKPKLILLKMYGRDRGTFFDNPASNIHTLDSAGIKKMGQHLKRSPKNRLSSQTSYIKDDSVINTNSNRVKHRSVPIINVHVRSFSTIRNYKQCNKTVSTIQSKSTPFINNGGPFKDQQNKNSLATNLRTKLSDGTTANPIVEKKRNRKKELKLQKSWITIKNGVYAKQADQILTSVSAPPKGGNKLKRKYRKKSLKKKLKGRQILEFEKDKHKQVRTTSVTDESPGSNELNVKVLYKRQCYNSKMKLKGNDSETNVHIGNMSGNKLEFERPNLAARVNHGNAIPSQMNQSAVDKCVNRTKLSSLKVLLPPSAENVDSKKPRRWKSKADRLNKLRFYKKKSQRMLNVNQQLATMSNIRNNLVQSNEQLAQCAPFKSVNLVDKLNHDVERLITNINKYKFPRRSKKYYLKSHLSTSYTEPVLDNLGGYKNNNIYEESQVSRISSVSNTINDCNVKIAKAGVKCNCEQNQTSINSRGKINLPLLDELSKSQLSKSVPGSTGHNSVNKNKQSGNHAGLKGFTEGLTKLSVGATKASRKHKSTLDYRMDTMVSKLLPQAIKADNPKTKSVDRSNKVKNQPGKLKPILQDIKALEGIVARYKPECSITNEPLHVARSVNNNFNSSNISRGKILSKHVESVKNINTKVASKEDSQINHLVESKTKTHSAQNISVDKSKKLNKRLERLREVIPHNQNKKEVINIESFRGSNTNKTIDKTKNKLSKEIVSATPTLDKLIRNASKPDNNHIQNIKLNVAGKINTLDSNNEIIEMKNKAHLNSSKTFEKDLVFGNDQNRNTHHKGILRAMQIKHGAPAYGKSFPKEERRPPNVKKLNFNKIKNDTSKLTKETLKCSGNPVIFTSKPTLYNTKVKKDQPQILLNEKKVNKITEKSVTLSSGVNRHLPKKISFSKASTLTIDKSVNISDPDKTTTTLKLDINKPLERNRSPSEASYKNEFTKTAVKHRSNLLAPNIKKPILLHQTNDSEPPHTKESVKFREKRLISLTNKKEIATEIISTPIKPLNISNTMAKTSNRDEIKSSTFTQPPVCDSKPSKTIPVVPSFMDTHKLKSLEQQKQEKILTQQPIEQVNSFHGCSFKEEPTKKQANLITNLKQCQVSDKITKAVTKIQQKISTHAVSHKNESKKQNTRTDIIEKQAGKGTAKVAEENSTSYDISGCTMRGRGIHRGLEPGFI